MTAEDTGRLDEYLWDPAAPPSAEVVAIERRLVSARFNAARHPMSLPARQRSRGYARPILALAASVALLAAAATAFWSWRWNWPDGAPWRVVVERTSSGSAGEPSQLRIDDPLRLDAAARVDIARIGTMQVQPGSALTLSETTSKRHRVTLDRGTVRVRIWAPPGRFAFRTPSGSIVDLGCIFDLTVDEDGTSHVRVDTGWVQMYDDFGESLVPAGTSSLMRAGVRPAVPIYDDASLEFAAAVRAFEETADEGTRRTMVDRMLKPARRRDVLTLLMLANASPASLKRPILERAAQLLPPPPDVSVDEIVAGDSGQIWRWYRRLDLPPAKDWLHNWRDALPWAH
jgi:FecR protein